MRALASIAGLLFPLALPAADYPPQDHGGGDLILSHGDRIWGAHRNIGRFEVPAGAQVDIHRYYPDVPGAGRLDVYANEIVVAGTLHAEGAGYTGGGGSAGQGVSGSPGRYSGVDGIDGLPRYVDYEAFSAGWPNHGDGPAGGRRNNFTASIRHGGYNEQNLNTDTTTDISVLMGSGGAGAYPSGAQTADPWCQTTPRGGNGGAGGGPGGGAVRLFADTQLEVSGVVYTVGAFGVGGTSGQWGALYPHQPDCPFDGGDGGNGGRSEALNFSSLNSGSGAGGGVLLFCAEPGGFDLTGTVDARSSEWAFGGSQTGIRNGGTIKVFFKGDQPTSGTLRGGRTFFRNLETDPLTEEWWIISQNFPQPDLEGDRRLAVNREE